MRRLHRVLFLGLILALAIGCSSAADGGGDTQNSDTDNPDISVSEVEDAQDADDARDTAETGDPDMKDMGPDARVCDPECLEGFECNEDFQCQEKECKPPCAEDYYCYKGECAPDDCVPPCGEGYHCDNQECVEDPCGIACEEGYECRAGECVPEGTFCEGGCADWQVCEDSECVDIPCDPECGDLEECYHAECIPICDPPCNTWEHCNGDSICEDNPCAPECGEGFYCFHEECLPDCPEACDEGYECDAEAHECVEMPCDPECLQGYHCEFGDCVEDECEEGCPTGSYCELGECVAYECVPDCQEGYTCLADNECVEDFCEVECGEDQKCVAGECMDVVCDPECELGFQCEANPEPGLPTGLCQEEICNPVCDDDYYCDDGFCYELPCVCEPIDDPTCGLKQTEDGLFYIIYDNPCELGCDEAEDAACGSLPMQEVCDVAGFTAYDNACFAGCAGVDIEQLEPGACTCEMTCAPETIGDGPYCGVDCMNYTDQCEAGCADVDILYQGKCDQWCGVCDACYLSFLDPVCGDDGQSYANECDRINCTEAPKPDLACPGECVADTGCACGTDCVPVCGSDPDVENGWKTFANQCVANCEQSEVFFDYICSDCDPSPDAPVCGYNLITGAWENLLNDCVATSQMIFSKTYAGICVCCGTAEDDCCDLTVEAPVCGVDGVTYGNECALGCAGVMKDHDGECACPTAYDPVCGESIHNPGVMYTYGNACVAASVFGVTEVSPGACPTCGLICDQADNQMGQGCALDGVSYPNICVYYKCNGDAETLGIKNVECMDTCENCPQ